MGLALSTWGYHQYHLDFVAPIHHLGTHNLSSQLGSLVRRHRSSCGLKWHRKLPMRRTGCWVNQARRLERDLSKMVHLPVHWHSLRPRHHSSQRRCCWNCLRIESVDLSKNRKQPNMLLGWTAVDRSATTEARQVFHPVR